MLEPVQCGIERALVALQDVLRDLLYAFGDRPPVQRRRLKRAENEEVERARKKVGSLAARHGVDRRHYSEWCRLSTSSCRGREKRPGQRGASWPFMSCRLPARR